MSGDTFSISIRTDTGLSICEGQPVKVDPATRHKFFARLGDSWRDLADYLEVPASDQRRWWAGREARELWQWLQERDGLSELPTALAVVGRRDLTALLGGESAEPDHPTAFRGSAVHDVFGTASGTSSVHADQSSISGDRTTAPDPHDVFVIHGRDEEARRAIFGLLRAIGLRPLEWEAAVGQTGSAAPFLGAVVDTAFRKIQAAVAILTPDDVAFMHPAMRSTDEPDYEMRPTGQARPNVLFELGMAMALHPERTVIIEIGQLRPFADLGGRNVIRFDGSVGSIKKIVERLRIAGCDLNDRGTDWLNTGPFNQLDAFARRFDADAVTVDLTDAKRRDRALSLARSAADPDSAARRAGLSTSALQMAEGITEPGERARSLAEMSRYLSGPDRRLAASQSLRAVRMVQETANRRLVLLEIARYLDDETMTEAFDVAEILAEVEAPIVVAEVMKYFADKDNDVQRKLRARAVRVATEVIDPATRATVLAAMAPYLDYDLLDTVVQHAARIADPDTLSRLIESLAPHLVLEQLDKVLLLTWQLDDDTTLKRALISLAPYLYTDQRDKALAIAGHIEDPKLRSAAQRALRP
ncbi:hypothetical protein Val02_05380 [Virgisporangium aliadipatigenens]|uniref:CD-NTase-associated protein 12/Pycsar effector protein TIR domain-containing protein n=1 Tax=Virgisporangium aliadipatigenens TaxID=741659 RepID=A0A8J3YFV8_9ACTN|nr:nucleotide-binding protein [Virgisporangium aliadipatigenens]GIJ43652.1 hypothetical protein Val02_05380 [Virgisporangium aliadipatigenens]